MNFRNISAWSIRNPVPPLVLFAVGGGALLPKTGTWMVTVRNAFGVLLLAAVLMNNTFRRMALAYAPRARRGR